MVLLPNELSPPPPNLSVSYCTMIDQSSPGPIKLPEERGLPGRIQNQGKGYETSFDSTEPIITKSITSNKMHVCHMELVLAERNHIIS